VTKSELIKALEPFDDDHVVVCMDESGGWDNIEEVKQGGSSIAIIFGGGSPFSGENATVEGGTPPTDLLKGGES